MVDLSRCYLDKLGDAEKVKLEDLRARIPALVERARSESAEAKLMVPMTIWKVDIEAKSDAADIILLKYLRAEELDVEKAAERLVQTMIFRADCRIDSLRDAALPEQFQGHDFISGCDPDGRPVMVSTFGTMDIDKVFGDTEAFVRYRAKLMEQAIELLKFEEGAAEDLTQIHDYSGVLGSMYKASVKNGVSAVSKVFAEHYPEFKGKTMFLNFPGVFSKPFKAFAALLPERTRKKFVILGKEDHLALFEHIGPELVPASLGGLHRDGATLTSKVPGKVSHLRARASEDVPMLEVSGPSTIHWELRVCYAEVAYEVFFKRNDDGAAEEPIRSTEAGTYLTEEDGIVEGDFAAPAAGTLFCRFKNERAWFKARVGVCRAAVATK